MLVKKKKKDKNQKRFRSTVADEMGISYSQNNSSLLFLLFQVDDPAMEGIKKPIRTGKTPKQYRQFVISVMQILPRVTNKSHLNISNKGFSWSRAKVVGKKMKMRKKLSNYSRNQCMAEKISISECALGCLFKRAFCQEMWTALWF